STSRAGGRGIFQLCSVRAKTQDGQLAEKTFQKREELKSMSTVTKTNTEGQSISVQKRVILSMGGKGGVGKTSVIAALAEWFETNKIPMKLLDLDTENKSRGSLTHFFGGRVPKLNIHTPAGLDAFIDHLQEDPPVLLADMGAGSGRATHEWFDAMYPDIADAGIVFTAIGV